MLGEENFGKYAFGETEMKKIPIIIDTDIGTDIDDTWALAMALNSPELDIKLITTARGDTVYRAKLVAKFLQVAGRTDIPIGIGIQLGYNAVREPQADWLKGFNMKNYKGRVFQDGVDAIIKTITASKEKVTVIGIAPLPNIARALSLKPEIVERAKFVGMHGSINMQHEGKRGAIPEWNVCSYMRDANEALSADWDKTITPLDTCGNIRLSGERYQKCFKSGLPVMKAVMENYRHWLKGWGGKKGKYDSYSSILFDTVAVYLAYDESFLKMKKTGLRVTNGGFTRIEKGAPKVNIALEWKDKEGYLDHLVERLTG